MDANKHALAESEVVVPTGTDEASVSVATEEPKKLLVVASVDAQAEPEQPSEKASAARSKVGGTKKGAGSDARHENNVRKTRIEKMMSKAELARRANLSVLTIDRIEKGFGCRMDTKRKILEALGLSLADRVSVFGEEE